MRWLAQLMLVCVLWNSYLTASAADKPFEVMGIGGAGGMYAPAVSPRTPI